MTSPLQPPTPNPQPLATDPYAVRLPDFEGPLDVLLRLIEKREMEISKIALALVADQFIAHINRMAAPEPKLLASFLVIAAKLLYIKSQALLPQLVVAPPPGTEDEEDVAAELVQRLEEYRAVQVVARQLRERESEGLKSYARPAPLIRPIYPPAEPSLGLEGVTLAQLVRLVHRRMQLTLPLEPPPALIPHEITLEEKVAEIRARLAAAPGGTLTVELLLAATHSRPEVVITFMAVLELARRYAVLARQDDAFGEIVLQVAPSPPAE